MRKILISIFSMILFSSFIVTQALANCTGGYTTDTCDICSGDTCCYEAGPELTCYKHSCSDISNYDCTYCGCGSGTTTTTTPLSTTTTTLSPCGGGCNLETAQCTCSGTICGPGTSYSYCCPSAAPYGFSSSGACDVACGIPTTTTTTTPTTTTTVPVCTSDQDCINLKVYCEPPVATIDYGHRYAKCQTDVTKPNYLTCTVCGGCQVPANCDNECCEYVISAGSNCVPLYTLRSNNQYLCASASPTGWHECDEQSVLKMLNVDGNSYICMSQNGKYAWAQVPNASLFAIFVAIAFVLYSSRKNILKLLN